MHTETNQVQTSTIAPDPHRPGTAQRWGGHTCSEEGVVRKQLEGPKTSCLWDASRNETLGESEKSLENSQPLPTLIPMLNTERWRGAPKHLGKARGPFWQLWISKVTPQSKCNALWINATGLKRVMSQIPERTCIAPVKYVWCMLLDYNSDLC